MIPSQPFSTAFLYVFCDNADVQAFFCQNFPSKHRGNNYLRIVNGNANYLLPVVIYV